MTNIQNIKKTSLDDLLKKQKTAASGAGMSQQVAEAIKAAGQQTTEEKLQKVESASEETGKRLRKEVERFQANETAQLKEPEDGLQRMIKEAQLQTDATVKTGMTGSAPAVRDAGLKLRQIYTGTPASVPMSGQTESDKEEWEDTSYLTPQSQLKAQGQTLQGAYIDPKAGTYMQQLKPDGSYEQTDFLYQRDGTPVKTGGMTEAQVQDMIRQAQDDSFALTGRVYRPNADGSVPQWLSVGDQVVTAGGTYVITGYDKEKGTGYHSKLLDPNQTTDNYQGNYNTGTYGSIIGKRNEYNDAFKGFRDTNGEYDGYGGYSINRQTGEMQFDTVSHTYDGNWTRSAIVDGVPYELDAMGNLLPMEAGSLVQDASQRYWVVGADGNMIDVTPEDPLNNPLNDPTGMVSRIQREEAEKAGIPALRAEKEAKRAGRMPLDLETQALIRQIEAQQKEQAEATAAANRDLYRQYRTGEAALSDELVGAGLHTTGAAERSRADLTADWLAAMNANQQQLRKVEDDAAYQIENAKLQARQQAEADRQEQAMRKADTLAQYGDFSGYADLGYTPAQIAGMQMMYQQQNAPDETYGGLSKYAQTLLEVYQNNPKYDLQAGLEQALNSGLISQLDYQAALQAAAGLAV